MLADCEMRPGRDRDRTLMASDETSCLMADKYADRAKEARCASKQAFDDEQSARAHNRGQQPYLCPECGLWHLTSLKVNRAIPERRWARRDRKGRRRRGGWGSF